MSRAGHVVLILLVSSWPVVISWPGPGWGQEAHAERGLKAFQRGAFAEAASAWTEAAREYARQGNEAGQLDALIRLSQAQSALGHYQQAAQSLNTALSLAEKSKDPARIASVLTGLGSLSLVLGSPEQAETSLRHALGLARSVGNASLVAATLNNLGNVLSTNGKHAEALAAYRESAAAAKNAGQGEASARAVTNAASAARQSGKPAESRLLLDEALAELTPLRPSHDKAFTLVSIGVGYRDLRPLLPDAADPLLLRAGQALTQAATEAVQLGDHRTTSYAWGYLGGLYEEGRRYDEALQLTRRAIFEAQLATAPESLYRWQWQAGRLLRKLGQADDAIGSYRRAIVTLQGIRPELTVGLGLRPESFRESTGPLYFELVDLLLQRAASLSRREEAGAYLIEAREIVEQFKAAELRDYFRDDCVDTALAKATRLDVLAQKAVVIYPVVLPDRLELLVSLPEGLKSVVVPVGAEKLTQEVRLFRRRLEKRTTREYLPHAQRLYDWLIRPLEKDLAAARVDTLVFVPDGALRTIPMAALHDGKQFLVAKYATAITPGLSLTDPRPIPREGVRVLAVGVTEAVQGFPALPNVATELQMLQGLFKTTTLVDKQFVTANFEKELKEPYTILHIASHGQFEADSTKSFLLTFNDKLTMDKLDQFIGLFKYRDDPLELLTLSACDTAEGDDRAALGLAGVAVKAGARSAMATLWQVHDEVAAELVTQFYRGLQDPTVSRAVALQRAQLKVLGDARYDHPGFWSPFLMINNWL